MRVSPFMQVEKFANKFCKKQSFHLKYPTAKVYVPNIYVYVCIHIYIYIDIHASEVTDMAELNFFYHIFIQRLSCV